MARGISDSVVYTPGVGLIIIGEGIDGATEVAGGLIAVGVIAVAVAKAAAGRMLVYRICIGDRCVILGGHIADGVIAIAQVIGADTDGAEGRAGAVASEGGGQTRPVGTRIVILKALFLPSIDGDNEASDGR